MPTVHPIQPFNDKKRGLCGHNKCVQTVTTDELKDAGLRYAHADRPGITRVGEGDTVRYLDQHGHVITSETVLARIRSLAIPPAYEDVWICSDPNGHLQATGRDNRGRKQYRYHPHFREVRDEAKFEHVVNFAIALPTIRKRVLHDLRQDGLLRDRILATVVSLLEETLIRVGNQEYARENKSFGLTTMKSKHLQVEGTSFAFSFRGKSGIHHDIRVRNRRLAPILKKLQHLPGQELFQYLDAAGDRHDVTSELVNAYISEAAGEPFTAKDFRTWAGTVACAKALSACERAANKTDAKRLVTTAIKETAARLGNTPAICRKCYVHPAVIEHYMENHEFVLLTKKSAEAQEHNQYDLRPEEEAVLAFLQTIKRVGTTVKS